MNVLQAFLADATGAAAQTMLLLAFLDFALGVMAAVRDGTFELGSIAAFLRKHILGRVMPISLLLFVTYATGDSVGLLLASSAAAATYTAETISSLKDSIGTALAPQKAAERAEAEVADGQESVAILSNPVPTD